MKTNQKQLVIAKLIEEELVSSFNNDRKVLRQEAKIQIAKVQDENRKTYNLRRKTANKYLKGDLIAIKRTQFGTGLKLKAIYLGPYEVVTVKKNNTYDVTKVGLCEGHKSISTCAEYMKPWYYSLDDDEFETNSTLDGRNVG